MTKSVLILMLVLAAVGCRVDRDELAARRPIKGSSYIIAHTSSSTLPFFSPKIALEQVRFVFSNEGKLFVELSDDQMMLYKDLSRSIPGLRERYYMKDELLPYEQRPVVDHIPEAPGNRYCVFFPAAFKCEQASLAGVTVYPTGDGDVRGFLGILDHQSTRQPDLKPIALAFRCDTKCSAEKLGGRQIDASKKAKVRAFLGTTYGDPEVEVVDAKQIYMEYPAVTGVLTTAGFGEKRYLFCLLEDGDELQVVPFPRVSDARSPEGGLPIEVPKGQTDVTPRDSEVIVLPDMDGNGSNELLVRSTVSRLFRIVNDVSSRWQRRYLIEVVRASYFGP